MFGYVVVNQEALDAPSLRRYRAFYCGLCRTLGGRYGMAARMALTYDMTFLILLLGSLYEPEEGAGDCRCRTRCTATAASQRALPPTLRR